MGWVKPAFFPAVRERAWNPLGDSSPLSGSPCWGRTGVTLVLRTLMLACGLRPARQASMGPR